MSVKLTLVSLLLMLSVLGANDKDKQKKELPTYEYSADIMMVKDGQYTIQFKIWEHKDGKKEPDVLSTPKVTFKKDNEAVVEIGDEKSKIKCTAIVRENDKKKEVALTTLSITKDGVEIFKEAQLIKVK